METIQSNVPTGDIRIGNVVHSHGMRIHIDEIRTYPGGEHGTVYACLGTVLNMAEVITAGIIPRTFMYDNARHTFGPGHGREDYWNVQGNNLARWSVER